MEIVQELRTLIRTPENGPYQGHFIQAVKRSGNVCLYKHRDYDDKRKVFGYYVFTLEYAKYHNSDRLPDEFLYCKSKQTAYSVFNKLTKGAELEPVSTELPKNIEIGKVLLIRQFRKGVHCIYAMSTINERRTICYVYFKVKLDRLGNEKMPTLSTLKRHKSFSGADSSYKTQINAEAQYNSIKESNKRIIDCLKKKNADIKKAIGILKTGKELRMTLQGRAKNSTKNIYLDFLL